MKKCNPFSLFGSFQSKIGAFLIFCFLLQQGFSQTYSLGGVNYTPCGNTETVVAPFNSIFGAATTNGYSGMVLLTVSGTGASLGSVPGDAFYIFIPSNPQHDPNHYQLVTTIQTNVHHATNSINDAFRHIVYDVDANIATTPPYTPPYHANNTYTFIIDMNTLSPSNPNPVPLRLGVNDGAYGDNFCSGCTNNYTVQVTQLCAPPPCDDDDNDGICNEDDNCPSIANANQADADNDGTGDVCDSCPEDDNKTAPGECGCGVADTDDDGDGTANCNDLCPDDASKTAPGQCGCGNPDIDNDGDGVANCNDLCPNDANKTQPGQCGCGNPDTDNDGDGVANCNDLCPDDASKTAPGQCGCGNPDIDNDGDGVANCNDLCPNDANKTQPGQCGCGNPDTDNDGDGVANCNDLCPEDASKTAPGQCGCGNPNTDDDGDGVANCNDNCDNAANPNQADSDCDGVGNACDVCPGGNDSVDNNNDGLPDCKYPPAFSQIIAGWKCGNNKVYVAHFSGNGGCNTLCVSYNAIAAHIAHGDYIGPCGNAACGQNLLAPGSDHVFETAEQQELILYPNPAGTEVTFHLDGFEAATELTLFDYSGRIVWRQTLEEGQHELTLDLSASGFVNGIYMVKANAGGEMLTKQLVVSKQ